MASKTNTDGKDKEADPLPPAIIAQAEAAIFGNFENGSPTRKTPSRARSEYYQYQNDLSGSEGAALKK
jgi:hypothetical protein